MRVIIVGGGKLGEGLARLLMGEGHPITVIESRSDHAAVLGGRVARHYADVLHVQPLPFELPAYQSLLCWDSRTDGDAGVQWLRQQIVAAVAAGG